jgi:hypothetical protein
MAAVVLANTPPNIPLRLLPPADLDELNGLLASLESKLRIRLVVGLLVLLVMMLLVVLMLLMRMRVLVLLIWLLWLLWLLLLLLQLR